jgi:hypothetical protein
MRITAELRERCKKYGSMAISNFVSLPKNREEVRIIGRQMIRSGTSVAAHPARALMPSSAQNLTNFYKRLMNANYGSNTFNTTVNSTTKTYQQPIKNPMNSSPSSPPWCIKCATT